MQENGKQSKQDTQGVPTLIAGRESPEVVAIIGPPPTTLTEQPDLKKTIQAYKKADGLGTPVRIEIVTNEHGVSKKLLLDKDGQELATFTIGTTGTYFMYGIPPVLEKAIKAYRECGGRGTPVGFGPKQPGQFSNGYSLIDKDGEYLGGGFMQGGPDGMEYVASVPALVTSSSKTLEADLTPIRTGGFNDLDGERVAAWLLDNVEVWEVVEWDGQDTLGIKAKDGQEKALITLGTEWHADEVAWQKYVDQDAAPIKGEFVELWWD